MAARLYLALVLYAPRWLFYRLPQAWRHRQLRALLEASLSREKGPIPVKPPSADPRFR